MIIEDGVLIGIKDSDIDSDGKCVIPCGVTVIGEDAFYGSSVKSVVIPNSITDIGNYAFKDCGYLTEITIPYSVTSIGDCAFVGCDSLNTLHISDLTSWCNIEFYPDFSNPLSLVENLYLNNEPINTLIIPDNVSVIKDFAFSDFPFKEISIPNGVTTIGAWAFSNCESVKTLVIPSSVKRIEEGAFDNCFSLKKVIIEGDLEFIGAFIFDDCDDLEEIIVRSKDVKELFFKEGWSFPSDRCSIIVNPAMSVNMGEKFLDGADVESDFDKLIHEGPELEEF